MNKLAVLLADYVAKRGVIKKEEYNVYVYGFQVGLEMFLIFTISAIIAIYFHVFVEYMIFLCIFFPLRSYAGGVHLNHYISCLICSVLTLCSILFIATKLEVHSTISFGIFIISLISIKIIAPVNDINRPVSEAEAKYFNKKLNITLVVFSLLMVIFYLFHFEQWLFLESLTVFFMVGVLITGEIKYRRCLRKAEQKEID